ncbi:MULTISPECIES: hypothetical protein [Paraburkholderia]|uniref:hypothetical protein n=1 Tax=Paraburkholderia TaxID=1822464 RepID=UPI0013A6DD12|nr:MULTISPECIES: hypothetical protein [Paraburkholderia]MDH6153692.1 hypothetical protein [Paraburkholderia sp. WSM4179]
MTTLLSLTGEKLLSELAPEERVNDRCTSNYSRCTSKIPLANRLNGAIGQPQPFDSIHRSERALSKLL